MNQDPYLPAGCTQDMIDRQYVEDNDECGSCGHRYDSHTGVSFFKEHCKVEFCECKRFDGDTEYEVENIERR